MYWLHSFICFQIVAVFEQRPTREMATQADKFEVTARHIAAQRAASVSIVNVPRHQSIYPYPK
jgi:hypothetical protein